MISIFNLAFGAIFFAEGIIIITLALLMDKKIKKNPVVYLSSFILKNSRIYSFMILSFAFTILTISFILSAAQAFQELINPVWEGGGLAMLFFLAIFYYLLYH